MNNEKTGQESGQQEHRYPVPARGAILAFLEQAGEPQKFKAIVAGMELIPESRDGLRRRLKAMLRDGQLVQNRRSAYGLPASMDLHQGRIHAHPDGFGFLVTDDDSEDLYLPPREMRKVMQGDRVLACVTGVDDRGRRQGAVTDILERATTRVVGRFVEESGIALVVPDDPRQQQDVLIPLDKTLGARPGQIVVATIDTFPSAKQPPLGHVERILGRADAPGMAVDIALVQFNIPHVWPEEVERQSESLGEKVTEADIQGRKDLRQLPLMTIDGADARDFDDAVWCEAGKDGGFRLLVAIADVSHYVRPASALDREAQHRATSVYFPNRVVPMLPEGLSNGLCSLKPDVDRLAQVAELNIDSKGQVRRSRFYRAVIHSHARLTYDQAMAALESKDHELHQKKPAVSAALRQLYDLYKVLARARSKRGAIEFESTEVVFGFGEQGEVAHITPYKRHDAHKLIEECMIAANVAAARFLEQSGLPAPYRVHASPPTAKLQALQEFLAGQGIRQPWRETPEPADFARLLKEAHDRPDYDLIAAVLLRSQSLAVYHPENQGHFGLSLDAYAHFTSPIRRYADLLVHRAIGHAIERGKAKTFNYTEEEMTSLSRICSERARRAEEAERDVVDRLKCAWLEHRVGEEFDGRITGVTSFGLFVELDGNHISGLVHVTNLPNDYYHFDPVRHTMTGERGGLVFRMADAVRVKVTSVSLDERKVDFELVRGESNGKQQPDRSAARPAARGKTSARKKTNRNAGSKGRESAVPSSRGKKSSKKNSKKGGKGRRR